MKLFNNVKIKDILLIVVIVVFIALTAHFTLIDRVGFWRLIYPLQAQFAIASIHCSSNAPIWMPESLKYIIKNQKNLSNQIAYINKKKQQYSCQSGWKAATLFSEPLSPNTRFRYASMTKIITNDAIIDLINQDKLNLNDSIVSFLSELKGQKFKDQRLKKIMIADLLQQRSGFDRMRSEDVIFAINKRPWCPKDLKKLLKTTLDFEPNQRYAYDNRNTCLLGVALERVTGEKYRSYIERKYNLMQHDIKFVNGIYYADEVQYDFRNNNFWMESMDNSFDFQAISSSAGLSGSAKSLAELIHVMLNRQPLNILSISSHALKSCKISVFKSCNGYAMWQYQENLQKKKMYFRNGGLPAATSLAMITGNNEVIVWVSNGATLYTKDYNENELEQYFYKIFNP